MELRFNDTMTALYCPDCDTPLPLLITVSGSQVRLHEDHFIELFTAHALANPLRHPTFVSVADH